MDIDGFIRNPVYCIIGVKQMHDDPTADEPYQVARRISEELEIGHMSAESNFSHTGVVNFDLDIWPKDDRGATVGAKACKIIQDAGYSIDGVRLNDQGRAWIEASATTEE